MTFRPLTQTNGQKQRARRLHLVFKHNSRYNQPPPLKI